MTRERFAAVMATLSVLPGRDVTEPLLEVYWRVLGDLSDAEMEGAATKALRSCRFLPTPAELLALARPRNLAAEAGRVFEAVKALADYSPRAGDVWSETKIRIALGEAAADAFAACGGSAALRHGDEVWTRKHFVEAYQAHPPADPPPALPASRKERRELGRAPSGDARVLPLVRSIGKPMPRDFRAAAAGDEP